MSDPTTQKHYVAPVETETISVDAVRVGEKPSNLWRDAWRDLRRRPLFWFAVFLAAVFVLMSFWPTLFTQVNPRVCELTYSNEGPTAGHPLGYNFQGCDIYARVVWGAQTSLAVGLIATVISAVLGLIMGAIAGFYGGWLDALLSRVGDIFFAIPYILAALVVMTVLSDYRSVWTLALAIGGFSWASTARVVRAEILRVRQADFVMASRALGLSQFKTLVTHVVPNGSHRCWSCRRSASPPPSWPRRRCRSWASGSTAPSSPGVRTSARRRRLCASLRCPSSIRRSRSPSRCSLS